MQRQTQIKTQMQMQNLRPHIGIFGCCNVGKSSLINRLSDQQISIVSPHPGTTTDPVKKTIELGELGPIVLIDTAGIDDTTELGKERTKTSKEILNQIDLALLLFVNETLGEEEKEILIELKKRDTPYLLVHQKSDLYRLSTEIRTALEREWNTTVLEFSSLTINTDVGAGTGTDTNKDLLISTMRRYLPPTLFQHQTLLGDFIKRGDVVMLVTPIDSEAPQGRMILPQVQTIRDALDHHAILIILKESELDLFWEQAKNSPNSLLKPKLVVTDSQCFGKVSAITPPGIHITGFSILLARIKGDFERFIAGTRSIEQLDDGDKILILESCSHHVTADDIGRVKIPRWLTNYTKKELIFDVSAGLDHPPHPITDYKLVIQCGGCMLTKKQIMMRLLPAITNNIPVSNYGMVISYCHGIFERALSLFAKE